MRKWINIGIIIVILAVFFTWFEVRWEKTMETAAYLGGAINVVEQQERWSFTVELRDYPIYESSPVGLPEAEEVR